jgi:Ca2+-binding EF-hand superfamily protein
MKIMFEMMDTDNDGSLTFEEIMYFQTLKMKKFFHCSDKNADGKLDFEEYHHMMEAMHEDCQKEMCPMAAKMLKNFATCDVNKDY